MTDSPFFPGSTGSGTAVSDEALVSLRARAERGDWEAVEEVFDRLEAVERELKAAEEWARTMEHERDYQLDVVEVDLEERLLAAQQALREAHEQLLFADADANALEMATGLAIARSLQRAIRAALAAVGRDPQPDPKIHALEAIAANAESFHKGEDGKARALKVIAGWARDPSSVPAAVGRVPAQEDKP